MHIGEDVMRNLDVWRQGHRHALHVAGCALAGVVSGATAAGVVQPFDVVRTRLQADCAQGMKRGAFATLGVVVREAEAKGRSVQRALWQGARPGMVRLGVGSGTYFLMLQYWKRFFEKQMPDGTKRMAPMGALCAGGLSGLCTSVVLTPLSVVKTRAEFGSGVAAGASGRVPGPLRQLVGIARTEGLRGCFKGLVPTMGTTAPFSALYLTIYQNTRRRLMPALGEDKAAVVNFTSGLLAATGAATITQPMDVLRTRTQLGLADASGLRGVARTLSQVVRTQGPKALFTGLGPRAARRGVQTAIVWALYEELAPRLSAALTGSGGVGTFH
ncbi:unnamed protein product [Pedinophyceae sp. YPF-701]|nr:unnamed protein product [Pedinophyceae sp. YPF-701]